MYPSRASMWPRTLNWSFALIILSGFFCVHSALALPKRLGDLDGDGQITVLDLIRLINHINGSAHLDPQLRGYADVNGDGHINQADVDMLADVILGIPITPSPGQPSLNRPPAPVKSASRCAQKSFFQNRSSPP